MLARWLTKSHLATKEPMLRSAINAFKAGDPIPVIKIVLTEIEGILIESYRAIHGKGAKLKALLKFVVESAERKTGGTNTLLLSSTFGRYLNEYTFADFDPSSSPGMAGSRHAVSHGVAVANSYTQVRALQALLSLDQLAFCI